MEDLWVVRRSGVGGGGGRVGGDEFGFGGVGWASGWGRSMRRTEAP